MISNAFLLGRITRWGQGRIRLGGWVEFSSRICYLRINFFFRKNVWSSGSCSDIMVYQVYIMLCYECTITRLFCPSIISLCLWYYKWRGMDIIVKSLHTINLIVVLVITNPEWYRMIFTECKKLWIRISYTVFILYL